MIIYIDENLPPALAAGLNELQKPINILKEMAVEIRSIKTYFGVGTKDEDWIPLAGKEGACIITQDFNIRSNPRQRALYEKHKLGMFFIRPISNGKGLAYWEMVKLCISVWDDILKVSHSSAMPFAYGCTPRKKIYKIIG